MVVYAGLGIGWIRAPDYLTSLHTCHTKNAGFRMNTIFSWFLFRKIKCLIRAIKCAYFCESNSLSPAIICWQAWKIISETGEVDKNFFSKLTVINWKCKRQSITKGMMEVFWSILWLTKWIEDCSVSGRVKIFQSRFHKHNVPLVICSLQNLCVWCH